MEAPKLPVHPESDAYLEHFPPDSLIDGHVPQDFYEAAPVMPQDPSAYFAPRYQPQFPEKPETSPGGSPPCRQEVVPPADSEESIDDQCASRKNASRKRKVSRRKKKGDPNEPQRPVSAYALFFRDTQAAVKAQNSNATFGEVSRIVASLWDNLHPEEKCRYKKKTEAARKEYLKALAAYRANLLCKASSQGVDETAAEDREVIVIDADCSDTAGSFESLRSGFPPVVAHGNGNQKMTVPDPVAELADGGGGGGQVVHAPQDSESGYSSEAFLPYSAQYYKGAVVDVPREMNCMLTPAPPPVTGQCVRAGCPNLAQPNPDWEDEYCCSECVVSHCRDVFNAWIAANQNMFSSFSSASVA